MQINKANLINKKEYFQNKINFRNLIYNKLLPC